jgi:hypothetical protein
MVDGVGIEGREHPGHGGKIGDVEVAVDRCDDVASLR